MNFLILTPPPTTFSGGVGEVVGGVGSQFGLAYSCRFVSIRTQVPFHFLSLFYMGPLDNHGGPGCDLHLSQVGPPFGAPPVITQQFSSRHGLAERFLGDPRQPLGTLGPLLGDHLVTTGVRINSCSARPSLLGLLGPRQRPFGPVCIAMVRKFVGL